MEMGVGESVRVVCEDDEWKDRMEIRERMKRREREKEAMNELIIGRGKG